MLGAAGACEAAFLWLALRQADGALPPHIWDGDADAEIPPLRFVEKNGGGPCTAMLSNSFAFGGSNVAVVLDARVNVTKTCPIPSPRSCRMRRR